MRPFRFAAAIGSLRSRTDFIHEVQEIERVGYDAVVLSDHLLDQFGPISALGLAAGFTSRLGLGTFVFNNDLRHPVVLAQELATLDRLSDGRLFIGIGAGWNVPEYQNIGMPFDGGSVRIDRLAEAITILKSVFADGPVDFDGRFYTVKGLADFPRPLQRPHPAFLLGGGSPKLLRLAAREAQVVSIAPRVLADGTADVLGCTLAGNSRKIALIREAAGDRFETIDINTYPSLGAKLTDSSRSAAAEVATRLRNRFHVDLSEEDVLDSPHVFIGSVDSLVEKFQRLRETLSINHIMVGEHWQDFVPIMARLRGT